MRLRGAARPRPHGPGTTPSRSAASASSPARASCLALERQTTTRPVPEARGDRAGARRREPASWFGHGPHFVSAPRSLAPRPEEALRALTSRLECPSVVFRRGVEAANGDHGPERLPIGCSLVVRRASGSGGARVPPTSHDRRIEAVTPLELAPCEEHAAAKATGRSTTSMGESYRDPKIASTGRFAPWTVVLIVAESHVWGRLVSTEVDEANVACRGCCSPRQKDRTA